MNTIILTGDWHIGTKEDYERIDALLPKTTPLILMGDLIDAGINKGMQWNQDNITKQVDYVQRILKHRRVLGYVLGNHEERVVRMTGLNPYKSFLGEPKTEYNIAYQKMAPLQKALYRKIVIEHGTRVVQNPLAQVKTYADIHPKADVVALGHDHTLGFWRDGSRWLVRTGSLQEYPEYARKMILPKKVTGYIKYSIKQNKLEVILT